MTLKTPPLKPLRDNLVIIMDAPETTTDQGVYIPDNGREQPNEATVLAVGPDVKDSSITEGARILLGLWGGAKLSWEDQDYLIVKEEDLLGVFGGQENS